MNHHQRHLPPGVNRALCLCLLLCAVPRTHAVLTMPRLFTTKRVTVSTSPRGYLAAVGAPELRFQAEVVLAAMPALSATLPPKSAIAEAPIENPSASSATGTPVVPSAVVAEASPVETPMEKPASSKNKTASIIIRDDTRPAVRPEDFLPFFQFPTGGKESGGLNVVVPIPGQPAQGAPLPPSSATYTQTPK